MNICYSRLSKPVALNCKNSVEDIWLAVIAGRAGMSALPQQRRRQMVHPRNRRRSIDVLGRPAEGKRFLVAINSQRVHEINQIASRRCSLLCR